VYVANPAPAKPPRPPGGPARAYPLIRRMSRHPQSAVSTSPAELTHTAFGLPSSAMHFYNSSDDVAHALATLDEVLR
jgi:hypothetical protein